MKHLLLWTVIIGIVAAGSLQAQSGDTSPATAFPANLLNGISRFHLAVQMHGDARGNFGPCG